MPWLPFYASADDRLLVSDLLLADGDLALLVPADHGRWVAVRHRFPQQDGRYPLWHVPSGPLPLMPAGVGDAVGMIDDPFAGWNQLRISDGQPYFGNHPGLFWLNLRITPAQTGCSIGLSSIEWTGNHFSAIDVVAPGATTRKWARLRRRFAKLGPKVTRGAFDSGGKAEIFAFPSALNLLEAGARAETFPR